jgi:hypothetical protein
MARKLTNPFSKFPTIQARGLAIHGHLVSRLLSVKHNFKEMDLERDDKPYIP